MMGMQRSAKAPGYQKKKIEDTLSRNYLQSLRNSTSFSSKQYAMSIVPSHLSITPHPQIADFFSTVVHTPDHMFRQLLNALRTLHKHYIFTHFLPSRKLPLLI
jgi:hypothetical protein